MKEAICVPEKISQIPIYCMGGGQKSGEAAHFWPIIKLTRRCIRSG